MAKLQPYQVVVLREQIADAITAGTWGTDTARCLMHEHRVCLKTVYNHRTVVLKEFAAQFDLSPELSSAAFMLQLQTVIRASFKDGKYTATVGALKLQADVLGLRNRAPVVQILNVTTAPVAELVEAITAAQVLTNQLTPQIIHEDDR